MKESHWTFNGNKIDEFEYGVFGFVYRITNLQDTKYYIGKKKVRKFRTKKIKSAYSGKLVSKRENVESDWKTYTGSNKQLNEDISKIGKEHFKFEILALAYTQGQLSYLEEAAQMKTNALTDVRYYNYAVGNANFRNLKIDGNLIESIQILQHNIVLKE